MKNLYPNKRVYLIVATALGVFVIFLFFLKDLQVPLLTPGTVNPLSSTRLATANSEILTFGNNYLVDFNCTPICWSNFIPGQTNMADIFTLFSKSLGISEFSYSSRGDSKLPLNSTGLSSGSISINSFSDNASPVIKLRAFDVNISFPLRTQYDASIEKWLPNNLLKSEKKITRIFYETYGVNQYYLLIDFEGQWAVQYQGPITTAPTTKIPQMCPDKYVSDITIWSFSPSESDSMYLINSLNKYDGVQSLPELYVPHSSSSIIITTPDQINEFSKNICEKF